MQLSPNIKGIWLYLKGITENEKQDWESEDLGTISTSASFAKGFFFFSFGKLSQKCSSINAAGNVFNGYGTY